MTMLTEAEKEAIYDAARDGTAYQKPLMPADASPLLVDLVAWADQEMAGGTSTAWNAVLDIITDDTNDGAWEDVQQITDDPTNDRRELTAILEEIDGGESAVTVERHWGDEDDNPDAPPEGAETWTDYQCGTILIGVNDQGGGIDLNICRHTLDNVPVTRATLAQIHADLGQLLADPRVQAGIPLGDADTNDAPPTTMVRVKAVKAGCAFPMLLALTLDCAIERAADAKKLRMPKADVHTLWHLVDQVVEDLFGLRVGMGVLTELDSPKLIESAYQRGFQEAIGFLRDFMDLQEKDPSKAAALAGVPA